MRRRVWWSGRPIIYQATVTRQSTLIISPQRAHRPRNPPSSMGSSCGTRRAHGTFRGPFVWRRLPSNRCGRCFCVFLGGDVDRFTNPTELPRIESHPSALGTSRGPFAWRRLRSDRCGRCFCGFLGGDVDRFTNPTEPPKNRAPSGERCSPDGCPYSIQTDKGKSSRFSFRSPGNAKPDTDVRIRRIKVIAIRRRSEPSIVTERAAPQHPGN